MKKILFLLLLSVATYGQATFDEGIQLSGNQKTVTAPKVILQEAYGDLNYQDKEIFTENSAGAISGFALTNNGNGTVNIASGQAMLRATASETGVLQKYAIPAVTNLALVDNVDNFILVNYNAGTPTITVTQDQNTINTTTNSLIYVVARAGNTLHYVYAGEQNVDSNGKLRRRFLNIEPFTRAQGGILSFTNRNISVTAGLYYAGLTPYTTSALGATFTNVYNNGSVWTRQTAQTQLNNTQYNNAGTLTAMTNGRFRVDFVYVLVNSPSQAYTVMGTSQYTTLALARLATLPTSLPVELRKLGVLVGRVIIGTNNASITEASSAFDVKFNASTVINHNDTGGIQGGELGDYQHITTAEKTSFTNKENAITTGTTSQYWRGDKTWQTLPATHNPVTLGTANGLSLSTQVLSLGLASSGVTGALSGTDWNTFNGKFNTPTGLTTNYLPKWNGSGFGNSQVYDNGTNVGIGTNAPVDYTALGYGSNVEVRGGRGGGFVSTDATGTNRIVLSVDGTLNTGNLKTVTNTPIVFGVNDSEKLRILNNGNTLFGKTDDNGVDKVQVNGSGSFSGLSTSDQSAYYFRGGASALDAALYGSGLNKYVDVWINQAQKARFDVNGLTVNGNITALPATASNHVVVKSQLDAFVPSGTVKLTGDQTITGIKTFSSPVVVQNAVNANQAVNKGQLDAVGMPAHLEFSATEKTVWNNGKGDIQSNVSFGEYSLKSNSSGYANSSFGFTSLFLNTSGQGNSAFGQNSLSSNTIGNQNTAIGASSLTLSATLDYNSALGAFSLANLTNGSRNTALGYRAGYYKSGITPLSSISNSIFIGTDALAQAEGQTNQIVIGVDAIGEGSNTVTLGNTAITKTVLRGVVQMQGYTVATLPTGSIGMTAYVTNALTPVSLAAVVGGGAVVVRVFHNGTTWIVQ